MKSSSTVIFIFFLASFLAAPFHESRAQKTEYKIQPSDVLSISVHGQPDLTTKTRVTADGCITFPLIGKIDVKGLTIQDAELRVKGLLEAKYLVTAEVLVFVEEYHPRQVSVIGEVIKPDKYDMPKEKNITLLETIAMAGGFTKNADFKNVKVMRLVDGSQTTIVINTNDITMKAAHEKDIVIEAGDIISVPEGMYRISVIGEVNVPGKYIIPQERDITLLEAIAMAGGFTRDGDTKNVRVMRLEDGGQKTISIDANAIKMKGETGKDIVINPGDIISVPEGFYRVSVIGEVNKPGKYDMPRERSMTFMQAIAMAGGATKHADVTNARVMRMENGEKRTIRVNMKDITDKGEKEKDIDLNPEDIVYVPESFF